MTLTDPLITQISQLDDIKKIWKEISPTNPDIDPASEADYTTAYFQWDSWWMKYLLTAPSRNPGDAEDTAITTAYSRACTHPDPSTWKSVATFTKEKDDIAEYMRLYHAHHLDIATDATEDSHYLRLATQYNPDSMIRFYDPSDPAWRDPELLEVPLAEVMALVILNQVSLGRITAYLWPRYYRFHSHKNTSEPHDANWLKEILDEYKEALANGVGWCKEAVKNLVTRWDTFDAEWGEEEDFNQAVPRLPYKKFPKSMRDFIEESSRHSELSTDFATATALSLLSFATLNTVRIQLPNKHTEAILFSVAIIAESGERKSSAFENGFKKRLNSWNDFVKNKNNEAAAGVRQRLREIDRELKSVTRASATGTGTTPGPGGSAAAAGHAKMMRVDELEKEKDMLEHNTTKYWPRSLDGVTAPAVVDQLEKSWTGFTAITSQETEIFHKTGSSGSDASYGAAYLQAMSGEDVNVIRKTTTGADVRDAGLVAAVMTQPDIFAAYLRSNPSALDSGFLPRFNLVTPESNTGFRTHKTKEIDPHIMSRWDAAISGILNASQKYIEDNIEKQRIERVAEPDPLKWKMDEKIPPRFIKLRPEDNAEGSVFDTWRDAREKKLQPGKRLKPIASWVNKSPARALQIAAVLTLIDDPEAEWINSVYVEIGTEVMTALTEHYMSAIVTRDDDMLRMVYTSIVEKTKAEGRPLKIGEIKKLFTRKEADQMDTILENLSRLNKVRVDQPPRTNKRGRPPEPTVRIRPGK